MDVEASRNTEIAARLERAIQSALASSSWSSSSTPSPSPSPSPSLPLEPESEPQRSPTSLSDLLLLLHLDMEDPISRICMAFSASPLHQEQPFLRRPPLSFTSSLAYRRLVESLHIDDLEPDIQEAEAELPSESEEDSADRELFKPISTRGENKPLSLSEPKILEKKPEVSEISVIPTHADINRTTKVDTVPSVEAENLMVKPEEKHPSILDYTSKLEGISLEDFFTNPARSEDTDFPKPDTVNKDGGKSIENAPIIPVQKDSYFLDPLTDSIIPDGSDLFPITSDSDIFPNISSGVHDNSHNNIIETPADDGDPFSSWEGDFQSAEGEVTSTSWFESQQTSSINGDLKDISGNSPRRSELDTSNDDWANSWVGSTSRGNEDIFGLPRDDFKAISLFSGNGLGDGPQVNTKNTPTSLSPSIDLHTEDLNTLSFFPSTTHVQPVSQRSADVDNLMFGSLSSQDNTQNALFKSDFASSVLELNGENLFYSPPMVAGNSHDDLLTNASKTNATQPGEKSDKAVGALLAQLHDLSFMLSDTLVTKMEGLDSSHGNPKAGSS